MTTQADLEKDRPERPVSDSLLLHIVDEMPFRVIGAITFVAFFFVWGGVNNVILFFKSDAASLDNNYGLAAGAVTAIVTPIILWRIKRRAR